MGRKGPVNMKAAFALPRRALGRTRLQVSVLGFGTAPLGDLYVQLDDNTAIDTVNRAFDLGINLLDTSPHYGNGLAEHRCGAAIRRVPRQDIVVCTKIGRWMDPFHGRGDGSGFVGGLPHRAVFDYSYDGINRPRGIKENGDSDIAGYHYCRPALNFPDSGRFCPAGQPYRSIEAT